MKDIPRLRYKDYPWEQPFNPKMYKNNLEAARFWYEKWQEATIELAESKEKINGLDKRNAVLYAKVLDYQKRKWFPFVLQLVAVIGSGIGINIITSQSDSQLGWILVGISILLEFVSFFAMRLEE